jgi:[protein-PII] uridylyltransferase
MKSSKERFCNQLEDIVRLHRRGAGGLRVALALTKRLDSLIQSIYTSLHHSNKNLIAVVALGGYGRKELCFSSDTDVMFLIKDDAQKPEAAPIVGDLLHHLLDYGLAIGHSYRTIQECLEFAQSDLETWNSLLESRFICGSRSTFSLFRTSLQRQIHSLDKAVYVRQLANTTQLRHGKYGHSTKLLEPNIKHSAGGLRDLHNVLWLLRGTGLAKLPASNGANRTALSQLLKSPLLRGRFSQRSLDDAHRSFDFLLRCRNQMHLEAQALHDALEFNLQRQVAEALRYRATTQRTSVERFMQDYYVAARSVAQLAQRVSRWAEDRFIKPSARERIRPLDRFFALEDSTINLRRSVKKLSSDDALRAFLLEIEHNASFSHKLEDLLSRSTAGYTPLRSERGALLFRDLLNKKRGVSQAIHKMNDLGLLARWIPEWKGLVAFFQHNQYHFYTTDEHTLMVLAHAEALAEDTNTFGQIFQALPRRDVLYLAALLHDIAKPIRIGDHEIIGVNVARAVLKRLRYADVMDDVLFLVRNHLLMEQVAFRRNLSDPQTILDFASKFSNTRQLDLLYLLTYVDLSAVNKNVWTDWKGMLLFELYRQSRRVLEGKLTSAQFEQSEVERHTVAVKELVGELSSTLSEDQARNHLDAVESPAYLATFDAQEIAEHIRRIGTAETVSTIFKRKRDHTEVTIIARDAPFALSRFCGVLSANDANIFDAQIFTRNDGTIIDRFRVVDFISKTALSDEQCEKIHQELNDVFEGATDIEHLLQRHRMKWKRRKKMPNPNIRIDVEFEDHARFTIIDVYAPDMLGFLYRITGTMSMIGLNISFAKIATRVDGIVDSFYVLDLTGRKLDDSGQRQYVRSEILKVIGELNQSELVAAK